MSTSELTSAGHAPDAECSVEGGGAQASRCALWWREVPSLPGRRLGLVGRYRAAGADAACRLLHIACDRLRAEGCTHAVGPMDGSTWHDYRFVTWRGGDPPFWLEPDHPDDWPCHFEQAGFEVLANYWSSRCDDLDMFPRHSALDARLHAQGFAVRALDLTRLDVEIELLWRLASDAFAGNFLYTPISLAEFRCLYAAVIPRISPQFVLFAEHQRQAVGFLFSFPDLAQAARGEAVDTLVVKTLGVARARGGRGIGNWLVERAISQARASGLRRAIFALMHEDNPSRHVGRGAMRDFRRYSLFARAL